MTRRDAPATAARQSSRVTVRDDAAVDKRRSWHRTGPCDYEIREYERANDGSQRRWIIRTRAVGYLKVTVAVEAAAAVAECSAEAAAWRRYRDAGKGRADRPIPRRCVRSSTVCA